MSSICAMDPGRVRWMILPRGVREGFGEEMSYILIVELNNCPTGREGRKWNVPS